MKEAAGEANLTVVAIILIAVVVSVATPIVLSLMKTTTYRTCCTDNGLVWRNGYCTTEPSLSCDYYGETAGVGHRAYDGYISCVGEAGGDTHAANAQYYRFSGCSE